jgi:hypothetical protein
MAEREATTKAELLADIEETWPELHAQLGRLSESQLTTIKDAEGWTVKDHIIHMTAWERSMVFFLQGKPRHEGLEVDEEVYLRHDDDEINDAVYRKRRDLTYAEAMTQFGEVHAELMRLVGQMTDDELQKPYSHFLPGEPRDGDEPTALDMIYSNTADHFTEHLAWIKALIKLDA